MVWRGARDPFPAEEVGFFISGNLSGGKKCSRECLGAINLQMDS
jgi:hypothetical protein